MNKSPNRFIAITSGGLRLVFPMNFIQAVDDWKKPETLYGSVDWMLGFTPGESIVKPVLNQSFWGEEVLEPEVILVLEYRDIPLGIPGVAPDVIDGKPVRISDTENLRDCIEWSIMEGEDIAWCVNIPSLYRTLDLSYDSGDNIGGLDA